MTIGDEDLRQPDPGIDHDPALGDAEDPAEDRTGPVPLDGGLPIPVSEIAGEDSDPLTISQLPVAGGVKWHPPSDPIAGYDSVKERERASELPRDVVPNGR